MGLSIYDLGGMSIFGGDLLPPSDNAFDLGSASRSWAEIHAQTAVYATSVVGNWSPSADETYTLGETSTPLRWNAGYFGAGGIFVENTAGDAWVKIDSGDDAVAGNKGIKRPASSHGKFYFNKHNPADNHYNKSR